MNERTEVTVQSGEGWRAVKWLEWKLYRPSLIWALLGRTVFVQAECALRVEFGRDEPFSSLSLVKTMIGKGLLVTD